MRFVTPAILAAVIAAPALAQDISIRVENTQDAGGFAFTPFWFGVHDGSFDVFEDGQAAAGGITEIAELGDASVLSDRFDTESPNGTQSVFEEPNGPPVFSPGESASTNLTVSNPETYRFLNFASMVVPSNDLFVGNDAGIEIFDGAGNFLGPFTINIFGSSVWDNGTEVNDITNGPAFVQGIDATLGADESFPVRNFFVQAGAADYLSSIIGTTTAPGDVITSDFGSATLIGTITIVPAPAGIAMLAPIGFLVARRRR